MQQATLIYNPRAGQLQLAGTVELLADLWRARGWAVDIRPTQRPGHAAQLARQAAEAGEQLVLAAGGDGTLGEVANGLAGSETILAPLPVGTANSFARELHLPLPGLLNRHKLLTIADTLLSGRVQRIDLGWTPLREAPSANGNHSAGRHWLLWAGSGADGFVVEQVEPRPTWSKRLGRVGYTLQGLSVLHRLPGMRATVEIDGQRYEGNFLLVVVCNSRRYAGSIDLNPAAKMDDGLFEVWLFQGERGDSLLDTAARIGRLFHYVAQTTLGRHYREPGMSMVRGRRVTIHTEPSLPFQTDGERTGWTPFSCEVRPGTLRLLVPDTAPAELFEHGGERLFSRLQS
jgi:YegS/Rv2252/BmrU family lipid kinase